MPEILTNIGCEPGSDKMTADEWFKLKDERGADGNLTDMALAMDAIAGSGCDCGDGEEGTCLACQCERALFVEREHRLSTESECITLRERLREAEDLIRRLLSGLQTDSGAVYDCDLEDRVIEARLFLHQAPTPAPTVSKTETVGPTPAPELTEEERSLLAEAINKGGCVIVDRRYDCPGHFALCTKGYFINQPFPDRDAFIVTPTPKSVQQKAKPELTEEEREMLCLIDDSGYYDGCIMTVTDNICMGLRERGLLNSTHISTSVVRYTLTPAGRAAIEEVEG